MQRFHTPCGRVTRGRRLHTLTPRCSRRLTAVYAMERTWGLAMGEAAPQVAENGTGQAGDSALAALRWGWGEAYRIGHDAARGWWAHRRDNLGGDITADEPDALWQA